LVAWQKAMELVTAVYGLTSGFPQEERFGLTGQMRRAAVSIPSNIAEGQARISRAEFRQFLGIAKGSLREVETQLLISVNVKFATQAAIAPLIGLIAHAASLIDGLMTSFSSRR